MHGTNPSTQNSCGQNRAEKDRGDRNFDWVAYSHLTQAIKHGIGLKKTASVSHPYPTQADALRKVGDQYNRTRLTPFVQKLLAKWMAWTR